MDKQYKIIPLFVHCIGIFGILFSVKYCIIYLFLDYDRKLYKRDKVNINRVSAPSELCLHLQQTKKQIILYSVHLPNNC